MNMYHDGVEIMILPDSAKCTLTGKHPLYEMTECPCWRCEEKDECSGDCEYYTEDDRNGEVV